MSTVEAATRRDTDPAAWDAIQTLHHRILAGPVNPLWTLTGDGWVLDPQPVMYGGSVTEAWGPAWVVGHCECVDCLDTDTSERLALVYREPTLQQQWRLITHVRPTSVAPLN